MSDFWQIEREVGNVAVVVLDTKGKDVNVLSEQVLRDFNDVLEKLEKDASLAGVVITSGKKDFIVGADITEISGLESSELAAEASRQMQAILQKMADLKVPTVAAIHGQALGGGLELALACDWRIATTDPRTKLALPEIQLGLIPGGGGTQRLPRLIGIQAALDMILTGKRVAGKKAEKMGLVDAAVPSQILREVAIKYAVKPRDTQNNLPQLKPGSLASDLPKWATEGNLLGRKLIYKKAKEMVQSKTHGHYPASFKALEAVFDGFELSLAEGLELEADLFGQLVLTRESQSLVHLFHATTSLKKHRYKDAGRERFGESQVRSLGVMGAGFMGAGIATVAIERGIRVNLSDPNKDAVGRALKHARDYFQKKADRRRLKSFEVGQKLGHLSPDVSPVGFKTNDIIIEAVFEDLRLKQKLLKQVEESAGDNFIFASNTSALPIAKIAAESKRPDRVIGMHFFSPVEKMPLLEVVVTDKTADWVIARTAELGQEMGKQVIIVKDGPGFYTTRTLSFLLNEGCLMLEEGASIEAIDTAMIKFGFPVGPIALIDEVGIDVGTHVLETISGAFPSRLIAPKSLTAIADSGRLGRKNNKGFYIYENGKKKEPDHTVLELIPPPANSEKMSADDIVERCLLVFVNESIRCLEDGILTSPYDGDVGAVFGLGFPPFWGGPFKFADHIGADTLIKRLRKLEDRHGARFKPAELLIKQASAGQRFFPEEA
ncbi:MAG: fatty acid oxidation complex subunit alpha FadJ [Deltaproteobacteria bacterium]|nr:fatty acid oxidation complex subunit alpha FadJ [Deltaproteobacteria bacterium]